LSRHPKVQPSRIKEPSFFCSYFQDIKNPVTYFSLFENDVKWRVDCSHVYLTNPETHQILARLFPEARFILILRDPVRRSHAQYRWMRRYTHADGRPYELIDSFGEALAVENDRYHNPDFWTDCRQYPHNFFYSRSSLYHEQIRRYLDVFGRERFLFLTLAELSNDPVGTCERIAGFLDIDPGPFVDGDEWKFNVDARPLELSSTDEALLNANLLGVKSETENLLNLELDFSL
jgi:hypothetical protein